MTVQIRKLSDIITGTHVTTCSIHPSVVPKLMQEAELSHNVYKAPICYISNPTFANFHACKLDPLCSLSQASAVMTPWKTFINPVKVKDGGCILHCYLEKVLLRLAGSLQSPGSASSLPPGQGSQTGFSDWCGCNIKRFRFVRRDLECKHAHP